MASSVDLAGLRAVVTGASGGIGRAIARRLVREGVQLLLVARRPGPLAELAAEVGGTALPADVADPEQVEGVRDRAEAGGAVDLVVNAAGAFDLAPVARTRPEMLDRMLRGNLIGPFLVARAFLPGMLSARRGHLVTVGSVAGRVALPGNGAYSASKFGVRGLHAVLDQELKGSGVRATLVEPAATDTGIWDPLEPDTSPGLPDRGAMLSADAVADAVHFAITRPPEVHIPSVVVQRS